MKTIFVTRHQGAQEWARQTGVVVDQWETHLDPLAVSSGDTVIGVLPVALAAEVFRLCKTFSLIHML